MYIANAAHSLRIGVHIQEFLDVELAHLILYNLEHARFRQSLALRTEQFKK